MKFSEQGVVKCKVYFEIEKPEFRVIYLYPRWGKGSRLDCGSGDPGLILGTPLPRVGPLMSRRLKTSSDVPVSMSG